MTTHVRKHFLDYLENRAALRDEIENHLKLCDECRNYYAAMERLLDPKLINGVPRLEPDPFLPTRIIALSAIQKEADKRVVKSRIRVSLEGAALLLAVAAGIFIGKTFVSGNHYTPTDEIIRLYNDAVEPTDFASTIESVFDSTTGGQR
jgi:predicted anti-sigma-YlaC factor YlaD